MARVTDVQAAPGRNRSRRPGYLRIVEDVLDSLSLTEREYHHLNDELPLAADLVRRLERHIAPGSPVLLIGGGELLASVLVARGFDLSLWRFPGSHFSDDMLGRVERDVTAATLSDPGPIEKRYAAIVVPFVLEALPRGEREFLRALRRGLRSGGRVFLATVNQSRLGNRLNAVAGRRFSLRHAAPPFSFGRPPLPTVHEYHRDELTELALECGFVPERIDCVAGRRLLRDFELMTLARYLGCRLARVAETRVPNAADTLVAELAPRPGDDCGPPPPDPRVAVVVSAHAGGERLTRSLDALLQQTFPIDRTEILVLHDGRRPDVTGALEQCAQRTQGRVRDIVASPAEGPSARNLAMRATDADVIVHTDDRCEVPADWVESCVREIRRRHGGGERPGLRRRREPPEVPGYARHTARSRVARTPPPGPLPGLEHGASQGCRGCGRRLRSVSGWRRGDDRLGRGARLAAPAPRVAVAL